MNDQDEMFEAATGLWLDILEQVLLWIVAAALCYCVYLAVYFARIILEVA